MLLNLKNPFVLTQCNTVDFPDGTQIVKSVTKHDPMPRRPMKNSTLQAAEFPFQHALSTDA